jgi:hypothetical protein
MKSAYRTPLGKFPIVQHFQTQVTEANEPITEIVVNSLILPPGEGEPRRAGQPVELRGIAWDGGYGIRRVEVSIDGGTSWREAALGRDDGRFAFRRWSFGFVPPEPGAYKVMARASNAIGQTQADQLIFNPAGYHNNVIRPLTLIVA